MKKTVIQKFVVRFTDGTQVVTCCGPAIIPMKGVVAFSPIGDAKPGVCCHQ